RCRGRRARGASAAPRPRAFLRDRERKRVAEPVDRALRARDRPQAPAFRRARRERRAGPRAGARGARRRRREASRIRAHVVLARRDRAGAVDRAQPASRAVKAGPRAKAALLASLFLLPIVASLIAYRYTRPA